jgi:DNA-directed RNA polymerase subunit H (RpoH/RPB5)
MDRNPADIRIVILTNKKEIDYQHPVEFIDGSLSMLRNFDKYFEQRGISTTVVDEAEWQRVSSLFKIPKSALPKISKKAHEIVYSEAQVGDVVQMIYPSFNSGLLDGSYRLVVSE